MLLKPSARSWHVIAHYCGRLLIGVGLFMVVPLVTAIVFAEWSSALDFVIAVAVTVTIGMSLVMFFPETSDLTTAQGLVIVALTWMAAMFLGAIPLYLSGHYLNYLDACFDAMSGFATTGLSLIQDLDHVNNSVNMWRHLTMFMGGQGIAVVALSILVRMSGGGGAFEIYTGEARDEKVVPNVVRTARFIWIVSLTYLAIGVLLLTPTFLLDGMGFVRSFLHSIWIFMAAWDTGGFAPNSQNILFYHSGLVEVITMFFMIGGCLSFGLHYALWHGRKDELLKNIEPVTLFVTISALVLIVLTGLEVAATYSGFEPLFRKGVYHLVSAHTGTGYQTVYPSQFSLEWGGLAMLALMVAMGLGGSASSTAGGIKALRVAVTFKAFSREIKKLIRPQSAVTVTTLHHFRRRILSDNLIRNSLLIITAYMVTMFAGAALAMGFGYSFTDSLFESTSAVANVGLSAGVTSTSMPDSLEIMYIFEMWIGRLEFLGVFALAGLLIASWRGK